MKHFMLPKNATLREPQHLNDQLLQSPNPSSQKLKPSRKQKSSKENIPPSDPNFNVSDQKSVVSPTLKMKSHFVQKPPSSSNPLKRKLYSDSFSDCAVSDSGVKVVVRMRPLNKDEGEMIVHKSSDDSVSFSGQTFTFDSVADAEATQLDIFKMVGVPLVENCLAGFNSSVFAYGQTGSGKTYTMWGPANALLDEDFSNDQQGLTPLVFQKLFARISEEQDRHADKQLMYQCRCSFLEIYNEQITDLLDPSQRNLQVREDVKLGIYVENLREECVYSVADVFELLIKGLSNRRIGATTINAESSRSHCVFTCVVQSRCKSMPDGRSSLKTSKINLVDLAGSERQKSTGAAGERLKEAGNINRSLSQLGNLINILAEVSQTGKQRHIPYRDSRLTFLLQESLGGNAKLAMVCAISPAQSCRSETFSTLRFAQRAKAIKNKALVNEVMEDDVNHLREVIRQLRDELHRVKENSSNPTGWDPRRSLNLLKSLIQPHLRLPHIDEDGDAEMEIDEEAVEHSHIQVALQPAGSLAKVDKRRCVEEPEPGPKGAGGVDMDEEDASEEPVGFCEMNGVNDKQGSANLAAAELSQELPTADSPNKEVSDGTATPNESGDSKNKSINCESPTLNMVAISDTCPPNSNLIAPENNSCLEDACTSSKKFMDGQTCVAPPSEHLAASLHRGLEIIDSHCRSSVFRRSPLRVSCLPADSKISLLISKVDAGVQTFPQEEDEAAVDGPAQVLCSSCRCGLWPDAQDAAGNSNLQLMPIDDDGSDSAEKKKKQVPKAVEKVLAGAIRREMDLEVICSKQNSEIMQLNRLVQQYRHERECNAIIGQTREDKILRLESLMDGVLPTEEFVEEEFGSLVDEHELLKEKYENHPEVLRGNIELKRVEDELERYRNFYDLGERQVLLEELHDLRSQLHYYIDPASPPWCTALRRMPNCAFPLATIPEGTESMEEKLEQERVRWAEAESRWISLAEEMRTELDATRALAERRKQELETERKCRAELKEAMQIAMEGHARVLEQYADLEEKHIQLLVRHRKIQDGIDDVKKAASRAGLRGVESKFINALAAKISALKVEREKERLYLRDENKQLKSQLRDTAEAVQAAGELLARLKEAEEAVAAAQIQAADAEEETRNAHRQIARLNREHQNEIAALRHLPREAILPDYQAGKCEEAAAPQGPPCGDEPEPSCSNGENGDLLNFAEPSWFSGYDRCNI